MLLIQDLPNSLGDPAELCCIFIYVAAPRPPTPSHLSAARLSPRASLPVCLPLSSSMHYSFIILLQLPYRPHFGEDKTCHLWVESREMMGDFKEGEEEEEEMVAGRGRRMGVKNACPPPLLFPCLKWTTLSLPLFSSTLLLFFPPPPSLSLLSLFVMRISP